MDYVQASRGTITLTPNVWRPVPWQETQHNDGDRHTTGSQNLRIANCRYAATIRAQLASASIDPATVLSARMVAMNGTTIASSTGTHSRRGDVASVEFGFRGSVPRDQSVRVEFASNRPVTIEFARIGLNVYPR